MAAVHPTRLNIDFLLSALAWLISGCGLELLNNNDRRRLIDHPVTKTEKSKGLETAWKNMERRIPRRSYAPRPANEASRAQAQGRHGETYTRHDYENPNEAPREPHTAFLHKKDDQRKPTRVCSARCLKAANSARCHASAASDRTLSQRPPLIRRSSRSGSILHPRQRGSMRPRTW